MAPVKDLLIPGLRWLRPKRRVDPKVIYIVSYEVIGTVNGSESYSFTISARHVTGLPVRTAVQPRHHAGGGP